MGRDSGEVGNDQGNPAAAKYLCFQNPPDPPLGSTAWFGLPLNYACPAKDKPHPPAYLSLATSQSFSSPGALAMVPPAEAKAIGAALASMIIYILMAGVLVWRPQGLFPADA